MQPVDVYKRNLTDLGNKHAELPPRLQAAADEASKVDDVVGFGLYAVNPLYGIIGTALAGSPGALGAKILQDGGKFVDKIGQWLEGLPFFLHMHDAAPTWWSIARACGDMGEQMAGLHQTYPEEWTGIAGGKYAQGITAQQSGASAVGSAAQTVANACVNTYNAGFSFLGTVYSQALSVYLSLDPTDPLKIVNSIETALTSVGIAYNTLQNSLSGPASSLNSVPTAPGGSMPDGNWPIAATP
jgi:hypothetical protein